MYIKSIKIHNFRKIIEQNIELLNFNVFVGLNDSGKSTILKALNLFFNDETESGQHFDFNEDFCKNAKKIKKKANEIIIELEFNVPRSYTPEDTVIWKKVWRKDGFYIQETLYSNGQGIPSKKKINAWLNRVRYRYVPAVKSQEFFSELLGDLHDTLAIAIEEDLKKASSNFSAEIKKSTSGITKEIELKVGLLSILDLPPDLRNIFRSLEFKTGEDNILLSHRGDGIKTRHIPVILKFIADQENLRKAKGKPIISTIWGYEEPENSLEMFAAFDSAKNFLEYSNKIQILITTHSPAFYSIESLEKLDSELNMTDIVKIQFVEDDLIKGINIYNKRGILLDMNDKLGMLPLIEPKLLALIKEKKEIKSELDSLKRDIIVVEGTADQIIFLKAIEVFSPILNQLIINERLAVEYSSSGANGVADKLIAMCYSDKYKCCGIFDKDEAGKQGMNKVGMIPKCKDNNGKRIKYLDIKLNSELGKIIERISSFEFELEDLYSKEVWQYAKESNYIEQRNIRLPDRFPHNKTISDFISENFKEEPHLQLICLNQIKDGNKEALAKWIISQENSQSLLDNFKSIIKDIESFFNKPELSKIQTI